MASTWDLVIRGGTLIDPGQGLSVRRDVAFRGGRVAEVGERLTGDAAETIDAGGALVVPGLIDLHAHVYHGVAGLHADRASLAHGVTTVVDAGSAGWRTFGAFRDYVIPAYRSRVLAFVHLSATGLVVNRIMPELADLRFAEVEDAARAAQENAGLVVGIKVRIANGATGTGDAATAREALRRARQATDLAGGRLMVHVSDTPIPLPEILDQLRSGDIATHAFNGNAERVIGADGRVRPEVRAAVERGVVMDVGHASVHFDVEVALRAFAEGLRPTTISTDLHVAPPGRTVYNLRGLMSKFLALGLPVEEVVAAVTSRAASAVGRSTDLGSLRPGMAGDAAVLDFEEGHFRFVDGAGHEVRAERRLRTRAVVKDGRRVATLDAQSDLV